MERPRRPCCLLLGIALGLGLSGALASRSANASDAESEPREVEETHEVNPSIINLIATPERYEGKRIVTTGVLRARYENFRIYLTEQDAKHHVDENSIPIVPDDSLVGVPYMKKLDGEYVILGGRFVTMSVPGSDDGRMGVIVDITRLDEQ